MMRGYGSAILFAVSAAALLCVALTGDTWHSTVYRSPVALVVFVALVVVAASDGDKPQTMGATAHDDSCRE